MKNKISDWVKHLKVERCWMFELTQIYILEFADMWTKDMLLYIVTINIIV